MQRVAEHMRFRPLDGADFLQVGSSVLVLTETSHTTTGQESICSVTSEVMSANLISACQEFHRLAFALRKMCPNYAIFEEMNFAANGMDTSLFGSDKSDALQQLYQETRAKSFHLRACINEVEQSALMNGLKTGVPPPSGSAAPPPSPRASEPDGTREWGGAGIKGTGESPAGGAGGGRAQRTQTFCPGNGTTGLTDRSTGGGFPGACVGEHDKQQNASKDAEVGVLQGVGQLGTQTGSRGSTWSGGEGQGLHTSVTNNEWKHLGGSRSSPAWSPPGCPHYDGPAPSN